MKYENIPYRRWRGGDDAPELVITAVYARVMKRVGEAIKAGMAVDFSHQIVNETPIINAPYDTITVTITP